ncbi:gamma-glutamylcyclotransferase [Acidocella sp.]|uniref:gamma-glutamylcyclotransferase n=1 Tax=Acidocella sp. TaxID=50710 RepID=UPI0018444B46|nr:gamma-glutamylcyclotransferase [Acidocella sp.]NNM56387.1 gamma-glutamylcyclotransferase [Acidocella sp.]
MILKLTRESLLDGTLRAYRESQALISPNDTPQRTEAEMAALLDASLARHDPAQDLWVFGYGSLIWNPAFEYAEVRPAHLHGWHRRFCLKMFMGRGTRETPALVLALDRGGACRGLAFRIKAPVVRQELEILWQREMFGGAYHARWVMLRAGEERFPALTFVINTAHPRYIKELSAAQTAAMIAAAKGDLGTCREYLENTMAHLHALGLDDAGLARVAAALPNP